MWIYTPNGFLSIVADRNRPKHFLIRARALEHLTSVLPGHAVLRTDSADYRYRVFTTKRQVKRLLKRLLEDVTYGNFKNALADDADMYRVCSRVWTENLALDDQRGDLYVFDHFTREQDA